MAQRILLRVTKLKYLLIVLDRQIGRESKKMEMKLDLILQQLRSHFEKILENWENTMMKIKKT